MNKRILIIVKRSCWILLAVLGVLAAVKGFAVPSSVENQKRDGLVEIHQVWEKYLAEDGSVLEYRYRIREDAEEDEWLCMKTYLEEFRIYLDGVVLYDYSDIYGMNGGSQHIIRLPEDCAGQNMVIRVMNPDNRAKNLSIKAYLGSENEIWQKLFWNNMYALVFGIFMLLLGATALVAARFFRKSAVKDMEMNLLSLCGFIFAAGIWVVTDSALLLFVTDKTAIVSLISFVSFMFMPALLLKFINFMLDGKRNLVFLCNLFFVMAAVYLIDFIHPVILGYYLLFLVHFGCVLGIGIVLKEAFKKLEKQRRPEILKIVQGFVLLSVFSVLAFVWFYIDPTSQYAVMYCIGIFLFCLCLIVAVLIKVWGQVEENANTLAYKRLAYTDLMTGLLNRTAYMEEERKPLEEGCAYIILDINNLKQINDRYGHRSGDRLIITAAEYIKKSFGQQGKCYRIGGDEFLVICRSCSEEQTANAVAALQEQIKNETGEKGISLQIAAGYAVQRQEDTAESLFQRADNCMYENKEKMKRACR